MNKNFLPEHNLLTLEDWCGKHTDRSVLWRNYLFKNLSVSCDLEYWFYWMAYFMDHSLVATITALEKVRTNDVRYLDQTRQMTLYVKDVLRKCRCVMLRSCIGTSAANFPCQLYRDRFRCGRLWRHMTTNVGGISMCANAKNVLIEDVSEVMKNFLAQWLSEYYYVWKLNQQGRIHFPVLVQTHTMSLSDIHLWEVVCGDEEKQILSHPLLPHPLDFLEKHNRDKSSTLYLDKALFEYQIPGSLVQYPVVLSPHKPSIIPLMSPVRLSSQEEKVECVSTIPIPQILYRETTTGHKNHKKHNKKRRLSKILKETRKKNKTRRHRPENPRQTFIINQGDEYDDCSDIDDFSDYDDYDWF